MVHENQAFICTCFCYHDCGSVDGMPDCAVRINAGVEAAARLSCGVAGATRQRPLLTSVSHVLSASAAHPRGYSITYSPIIICAPLAHAAALASASPPSPPSPPAGIAPDDTVGGLINLFSLAPNGQPIADMVSVPTNDREYPKTSTLRCSWGSGMCYFATGVGAPYTQDAVYGVDRTAGKVVFKHELPQGIYIDNLLHNWQTDELYSVAFDPQRRTASIVQYDGQTGNFTYVLDISNDVGAGFVFGGAASICAPTNHLYVGVDNQQPGGLDYVLIYDLNGKKLLANVPLLYPIPSGMTAFCNATNLVALVANTIQTDTMDRETLLLGDFQAPGREGILIPFARGDLPTFSQRGEIPLFLNGMLSEFGGLFLAPVYPPFNPGPGPAPAVPGGLLWAHEFNGPSFISPLNYFLAGAAGVPNA